jgi:hypothetical protein
MEVVAHNSIGANVDGEMLSQEGDPLDNPLLAMVQIFSGQRVFTTKEGTSHTTGYAVIIGG